MVKIYFYLKGIWWRSSKAQISSWNDKTKILQRSKITAYSKNSNFSLKNLLQSKTVFFNRVTFSKHQNWPCEILTGKGHHLKTTQPALCLPVTAAATMTLKSFVLQCCPLQSRRYVRWSEEGSRSPCTGRSVGNVPYLLHYWRFGDGGRETYFLNQILSAMDTRHAKHKETQYVFLNVSFSSSAK